MLKIIIIILLLNTNIGISYYTDDVFDYSTSSDICPSKKMLRLKKEKNTCITQCSEKYAKNDCSFYEEHESGSYYDEYGSLCGFSEHQYFNIFTSSWNFDCDSKLFIEMMKNITRCRKSCIRSFYAESGKEMPENTLQFLN